MSNDVTNNIDAHRYELSVDGQLAIASYRERGDIVAFVHTKVPAALAGKEIGTRLIDGALADICARRLHVAAEVSFVADYLDRHPADLESVFRNGSRICPL